MDFDLKEEHEIFRKSVREFAKKEIAPLVEEADIKEEFTKSLLPKMVELGYLCITCPEEYGGAGGDKITECIFVEEVAFISLAIAICTTVHSSFGGTTILDNGTQKQKERYLPPAVKGQEIWGYALSESDAGSDTSMIRTTIKREGDHFVLNGTKMYTSNSTIGDYIIVVGLTDKTKGSGGLSLFILEKETPGFTVSKMSKVGVRASVVAELCFEDCILPEENQLGGDGIALAALGKLIQHAWTLVGPKAIGVARAAFEAALEHAKTRVQFNKPIGLFQANSFKLAEMALDLDAARLLTYRAAWLWDQGRDCFKEASMAKLFSTEMAVRITGQALQIHGAQGYMMESPVQRYFRDARMLTITEGSSEIQHINIARELGLVADETWVTREGSPIQ